MILKKTIIKSYSPPRERTTLTIFDITMKFIIPTRKLFEKSPSLITSKQCYTHT